MISNYLKKISIINYKNIVDKEYNLDPKLIALLVTME